MIHLFLKRTSHLILEIQRTMTNIFRKRDHSGTYSHNHILTNAGWKILQKGVIDVGLSDHQLISCIQKILRTKANMHNQIRVRSLRNYTAELFKEELTKINFPGYNIFTNVNIAYLDLVEKILSVVDKIAPFKDLRIKNNTQDWFDDEVAEASKLGEKRLKHFKSTKLHIDEELYKESKYLAMKLIKEKKRKFYKEKLKEKIGKKKIAESSKIFRLAL